MARISLLRSLAGQPISFLQLSAESAKSRLDALLSYLFEDSTRKRYEHYFYRPAAHILQECAAMTSTPFVQLVVWPQALLSAVVKTSSEYRPSEPLSGTVPGPENASSEELEELDSQSLLPLLERRKLAPRKTAHPRSYNWKQLEVAQLEESTRAKTQAAHSDTSRPVAGEPAAGPVAQTSESASAVVGRNLELHTHWRARQSLSDVSDLSALTESASVTGNSGDPTLAVRFQSMANLSLSGLSALTTLTESTTATSSTGELAERGCYPDFAVLAFVLHEHDGEWEVVKDFLHSIFEWKSYDEINDAVGHTELRTLKTLMSKYFRIDCVQACQQAALAFALYSKEDLAQVHFFYCVGSVAAPLVMNRATIPRNFDKITAHEKDELVKCFVSDAMPLEVCYIWDPMDTAGNENQGFGTEFCRYWDEAGDALIEHLSNAIPEDHIDDGFELADDDANSMASQTAHADEGDWYHRRDEQDGGGDVDFEGDDDLDHHSV